MPRAPAHLPLDGILVIDKPYGKTSHDVVEAVRRLVGFRQIGHLGTLDPLATGVLVLALGRATRLARFYAGRRKRLHLPAGVRFGFDGRIAYDAGGEPLGPDQAPTLEPSQLESFAARFIGKTQQMPPSFSAKKIHGRPAHELARKKSRWSTTQASGSGKVANSGWIRAIEGLARFRSGMRLGNLHSLAFADDLGKLQGSGAHLAEIARTAVGEFTLDHAIGLAELEQDVKAGKHCREGSDSPGKPFSRTCRTQPCFPSWKSASAMARNSIS